MTANTFPSVEELLKAYYLLENCFFFQSIGRDIRQQFDGFNLGRDHAKFKTRIRLGRKYDFLASQKGTDRTLYQIKTKYADLVRDLWSSWTDEDIEFVIACLKRSCTPTNYGAMEILFAARKTGLSMGRISELKKGTSYHSLKVVLERLCQKGVLTTTDPLPSEGRTGRPSRIYHVTSIYPALVKFTEKVNSI